MGDKVFIALGSNVGDRAGNIRRAIELISGSGCVEVVRASSLYETEPWGVTDQPAFINAAIEARTDLAPVELLRLLKSIEARMGRKGTLRWGPREIDLDIILYGRSVIEEEGLEIPHPGAHERAFVLVPLAEIAPEFVHPVLGKKISELLSFLDTRGVRMFKE